MADEMKIEEALAQLEAGKFSFRMVDAIKIHIEKLENELAVVRSLHASAIDDLRSRDIANWRLEGEVKKLNAKIHALLRANMLTEKAFRAITAAAAKAEEFLLVLRREGAPKAKAICQTAIREAGPVAVKVVKYLPVLKKNIGASVEKATAYISSLHKNVA